MRLEGGAQGDGDRTGDGPQPVLVEDQRALDAGQALSPDGEAVVERAHPDFIEVGTHRPCDVGGEREIASYEKVRR